VDLTVFYTLTAAALAIASAALLIVIVVKLARDLSTNGD